MMATISPPPAVSAAESGATRVPTLAQAVRELRLHGAGGMAEWQTLLGQLAAQVQARDDALTARRSSAKLKRLGVAGIVVIAAMVLAWKTEIFVGAGAAIAGIWADFVLMKLPGADYVGTERINFLRKIVDALAAIAPGGNVRLAAQLNAARSIPEVALPRGSGTERGEREDAWLRGSLQGIPGLRLSWQATEWRTVKLSRKTNQRGKSKTKAKFAYASRLAARLDADHALFALSADKAPPPGPEGAIDARKTPRGYTIRGWRERSAKTLLGSTDVREELAALRVKDTHEWFGEPASALVALIQLCEARLAPRGAKKGGA
jgi:hypothetical protein